jgi:polyisoprenoid-binding protein YceI
MPMSLANRIHSLRALALFLALLLILPGLARSEMARGVSDEDHFSVGFLADHIGCARVPGMFLRAEGHFLYNPETIAR